MARSDYQRLLEVFAVEFNELADELATALETYADTRAQPDLENARRLAHTIKGSANIAGVEKVATLAHQFEEELKAQGERGDEPDPDLKRRLVSILTQMYRELEGAVSEDDHEDGDADRPASGGADHASSHRDAGIGSVRIETEKVDTLMGYVGDVFSRQARLSTQVREIEQLCTELLSQARRRLERREHGTFIDGLKQLERLAHQESQELGSFLRLVEDLGITTRDLRMLPISTAAPRWRRVIRESASELGKQVELTLHGEDVELDKQVLDRLNDPMLHLLRNAVGHGLESPEERAAAGKPERGTVRVSAELVGGDVLLTVADDGRGLDPRLIRQGALIKGVRTEQQLEQLDDEQVMDLLFEAGFSTTEKVSSISGRGVGLDVVRTQIRELGGNVRVLSSGPLGGAAFILRLPTSMLSLSGLLVKMGDTTFAIPSASVQRILRTPRDEVRTLEGEPGVQTETGGFIRLSVLSGAALHGDDQQRWLPVAVLGTEEQPWGLVVDEVLYETEIISKKLPWNMGSIPGVSGAVVLPSGELALVLNPSTLKRERYGTRRGERAEKRQMQSGPKRILVVDDSLTARTLATNSLRGAGYEVVTAVDGQDALSTLDREDIDLIVTDIQMPRIDGFEFTRRVRASESDRDTPVILVSSLGDEDAIDRGRQAGANEYIVKGEMAQDLLLEAVNRHI